MADNFLEKQMEDYRSGRRRTPVSHSGGRRPGIYPMKYPQQAVAVLGADRPGGTQLIAQLVAAGATVALTAASDGNTIAQTCGGRFYPNGLGQLVDDLRARNQTPGAIIAFDFDLLADAALAYPNASKIVVVESNPSEDFADCAVVVHHGHVAAAALVATTLAHADFRARGIIRVDRHE